MREEDPRVCEGTFDHQTRLLSNVLTMDSCWQHRTELRLSHPQKHMRCDTSQVSKLLKARNVGANRLLFEGVLKGRVSEHIQQ